MVSNTVKTTAARTGKGDPAKSAFGGRELLVDRMSPDDHQKALHNEIDMGSVSRGSESGVQRGFSETDFDHSLF